MSLYELLGIDSDTVVQAYVGSLQDFGANTFFKVEYL